MKYNYSIRTHRSSDRETKVTSTNGDRQELSATKKLTELQRVRNPKCKLNVVVQKTNREHLRNNFLDNN